LAKTCVQTSSVEPSTADANWPSWSLGAPCGPLCCGLFTDADGPPVTASSSVSGFSPVMKREREDENEAAAADRHAATRGAPMPRRSSTLSLRR
jgi:hypothetical protein